MNAFGTPRRSGVLAREREVARRLSDAFAQVGWKVEGAPRGGQPGADLRVRRRGFVYAVQVKAGSESRPDRLVPLLAQAVLQAARRAGGEAVPLAVVAAPRIAPRAAEQVLDFAREFAPGVSVGVVDLEGFRAFRGPQLEPLNARPPEWPAGVALPRREAGHLFSDLNQWMLKVLLALELPEEMLSAPRGQYRNASELARAADVSVMSAFRFARRLRDEGYLHESAPHLSLVRRDHLFQRWQASAQRSAEEVPMRFVLPGDTAAQLRTVLARGRACLALYAAADALKLGHVEGLPPHVYVERFPAADAWPGRDLRPCTAGEAPHFIFRKAPTPQSVFRGVVRPAGVAACDVLQVWLDVAADPARGREQAELIRRRVLQKVIAGRV
jgi:hypothetical protein